MVEEKLKLPEQDKSLDSFLALPAPAFDREHKHNRGRLINDRTFHVNRKT